MLIGLRRDLNPPQAVSVSSKPFWEIESTAAYTDQAILRRPLISNSDILAYIIVRNKNPASSITDLIGFHQSPTYVINALLTRFRAQFNREIQENLVCNRKLCVIKPSFQSSIFEQNETHGIQLTPFVSMSSLMQILCRFRIRCSLGIFLTLSQYELPIPI
jgi:hypothetical protein